MGKNIFGITTNFLETILAANTLKQLEITIVESAKEVREASWGELFLITNEKLEKVYSSNKSFKRNAIIKAPTLKKFLLFDTITVVALTSLEKERLLLLHEKINSVVVVPLRHKEVSGFILLYQSTSRPLSTTEKAALTLLSQTSALAMAKIRLQEKSKKALEIRDRFISLASHELRTPLTSLHGYIQLLNAKMASKKTVEARWVKELHIESIRLTSLVKELLDVNRIKQGQFAFVFSEVAMDDIVSKVMKHYHLTNPEHTLFLQNKLQKDIKVVGDFDKLVEMVSGLIGNAIKFSTPQEKITISLKNNSGILFLTVKDTGKGISKKDLSTVFDGFYKSAHASMVEGMGVGLLLAKHIIDNHRGKIKITSKENKGTTVTVTLPTIKTSGD